MFYCSSKFGSLLRLQPFIAIQEEPPVHPGSGKYSRSYLPRGPEPLPREPYDAIGDCFA
jgi:hypothetical protein